MQLFPININKKFKYKICENTNFGCNYKVVKFTIVNKAADGNE